jgi:uncharacterized RDD family membrane protein YckC
MHDTPSIKRRLIAMVYETFLLLAVEALGVVLYMLVTLNSHAPIAQYGMKVWSFIVAGAYFIYSWTNSGHTLALKTWRMHILTDRDQPLTLHTATLRYLLAWGWFLPALLVRTIFGLHGKGETAAVITVGIVGWSLTALLDRDRQFLHDRLAGTRLVLLPKRAKAAAPPSPAAPAEAS